MSDMDLSTQPALEPPEGVESNFINPPNQDALVMSVFTVCFVITALLFFIRVWARLVVIKMFRVEDFLALAGFACFAAFIYPVVLFLYNTGFYVHQWNVPLSKMSQFLWILHLGANFYVVIITCVKTAIILDWLRIFVPGKTRNAFFWTCWAVLICNVLYYIANLMALNLACIPYQAIWDITITDATCLDEKALDISSAVMNLLSDFILFGMVQKVIWRLQMSLKRKLGVSLIFAAGILGCVAGAFRLGVTIEYQQNKDATYYVSSVILWMTAEMTCAYLVFCIPSAPKAFGNFGVPTILANTLQSLRLRLNSLGRSSVTNDSDSGQRIYEHGLGSLGPYHDLTKTQEPSSKSSSKKGPWSGSVERSPSQHKVPAGGIIRTTETETTMQRDDPNIVSMEEHGRQHPWIVEDK